jgi:hypothetical protein
LRGTTKSGWHLFLAPFQKVDQWLAPSSFKVAGTFFLQSGWHLLPSHEGSVGGQTQSCLADFEKCLTSSSGQL